MAEMITDKTMDEIEILAKLHLTEDEKEQILQGLEGILADVESGKLEITWSLSDGTEQKQVQDVTFNKQ